MGEQYCSSDEVLSCVSFKSGILSAERMSSRDDDFQRGNYLLKYSRELQSLSSPHVRILLHLRWIAVVVSKGHGGMVYEVEVVKEKRLLHDRQQSARHSGIPGAQTVIHIIHSA